MKTINKKRFLLCFILTFIFLSTNIVNSHFFNNFANDNTTSIVYARGSRSSGGGFKSSSFSAPKSMPRSSSSSSKSSSGGFKSGGFSDTTPKSNTSDKSNSSSSNYNSGSRNTFIPIPFFSHNSYSSGGYFGAGSIVGGLFGGLFKFILFLIIVVLIIRIIKKSKR